MNDCLNVFIEEPFQIVVARNLMLLATFLGAGAPIRAA
jgi:hypothetical protein